MPVDVRRLSLGLALASFVASPALGQCPPAAVLNTPTVAPCSVTLTWSASPSATSYDVLRAPSPQFAQAVIVGTPSSTAFTDTSAPSSATYTYWVRPRTTSVSCPAGVGPISNPISATVTVDAPPAQPTLFSTSQACARSQLVWSSVPTATAYTVRVYSGAATVFTDTVTTNSYTLTSDFGPPVDRFGVRALNACGPGPELIVNLPYFPGPPTLPPAALTATSSCSAIGLSWSIPTGSVAINGAVVSRSAPGQPPSTVTLTGGVVLTYNDVSALPGAQYTYSVSLRNPCGSGPATTITALRSPTLAAVTVQPIVRTQRRANAALVANFDQPVNFGVTWRRGVNPDGTGGTPVTDGGRFSGASSIALMISDVRITDADVYACSAPCPGSTPAIIPLVVTVPCPADFDGVNGADLLDIFAFLEAWFAGCP